MSGNGRGAQRTQSRSPPFLVIGLLVALGILGFNYWNLSSTNGTLSATNIDLQDQIRILTSKRLSEEQSKREVERKYSMLEQRIASKDSNIKMLQEEVETKKGDEEKAETGKKECQTNLQTCETNNAGIQQQLGEVNQQLDELKKKEVPPQNCDSVCKEQSKKTYTEIFQKLGAQPMQQLINAGVDIGEELKVQVQQAASSDNHQIQPPKKGEQQAPQQPQPQQPQQPQQQSQTQQTQEQQTKDGQTEKEGKTSGTPVGLFDSIKEKVKQTLSQNTMHDKLTKTIDKGLQSLTNDTQGLQSLAKDTVKQGLQSLSDKLPLHDILNQTQEGIKEGLKKSQELAGLLYGGEGDKLHESSNSSKKGDLKNDKNDTLEGNKTDTLVGNKTDTETKTNDNLEKKGETDTKAIGQGEKDEKKTTQTDNKDNPVAKTVKEDDEAYEDDDDDLKKVEDDKDLKFEPQKEENSLDAMRKNLDNAAQ